MNMMYYKIPLWNLFRKRSLRENLNDQSAAGAGEDYFDRLSDHLIVSHILDKISDAESLCKLSMVSSRMACLVFHAETVSIKIPCRGGCRHNHLSRGSIWGKLRGWLLHIPLLQRYKTYPLVAGFVIRYFRQSAELYFRLGFRRLNFLEKFTTMRSLTVDYIFCGSRICSLSNTNNESPMFKFKLYPSFGTLLVAGRVEFLDDYDIDVQRYQNVHLDFMADEVLTLLDHAVWDIFNPAIGVGGLMQYLLTNRVFATGALQRLQNVVMEDRTHGKIVFEERDLAGMRNKKGNNGKSSGPFGEKDYTVRFAPVLRLPSSGCVMTAVVLMTYKDRGLNDDADADELMLKEAFAAEEDGGEEGYFKEAALAMLKEEVIY